MNHVNPLQRRLDLISPYDRGLESTFHHAEIGISEVDSDGKLLRVNPHLSELLGYPSEQLVGRSIFDSELAEVTDSDRVHFERQVRGVVDHYTVEKRFHRPDGTKRWILITSSSVRDEQGRFLHAVRVQQDITARKVAEEMLARRAEEQSALYQFTEGLGRSAALDVIYAHAVTAIIRALRCDRASVLIMDEAGVMKFVAWRGLSENYRRAVEGHSPWNADAADPVPICIEDIETAEVSEELKGYVRRERIAALSFIPILADGRLIGRFMSYYNQPHCFTEGESRVGLTIARQLGYAIERSKAEAARRETERAAYQLAAIVESSNDAIISKSLDGIILTWNGGAERLFGYKAKEAVGQSVTMLIPPERLHEEPSILAKIRSCERVDHYETVRRRKDGSPVDISLTVSPVRDRQGHVVGASKIARDITDRKEAETKLQQSERRLQDLISAIPAAIYTTDGDGKITYFNQAAVELAGRKPVLGSDQWCVTWKLFRPDGTPLPHEQCPMAVALREGRAIRNAEAIAERPDGTRVPFLPYPTPLRDAKGKVVGAINMLVDISERKTAETRQRVLFNELNHRVKNNMQTLQSLLHMAERKAKSPEARAALREASGRIASMAAAQQVLYGTVSASHFNARGFLEAVCGAAKHSLPRDIRIQCEADDLEISNDMAMPLALIANELITNAAKHSTSDGQANIRVGLKRANTSFLLYIEDEGPGFDLASVRQRRSGLQLVEGLAGQIHGKFEVDAHRGARCTVRFTDGEAT